MTFPTFGDSLPSSSKPLTHRVIGSSRPFRPQTRTPRLRPFHLFLVHIWSSPDTFRLSYLLFPPFRFFVFSRTESLRPGIVVGGKI